jgi:hypothetical protein
MDPTTYLSAFLAAHPWIAATLSWCCAVCTIASVVDASLPQPKPGSFLIPLRKVVSLFAVNIGAASNAGAPTFSSWLIRILSAALASAPASEVAIVGTQAIALAEKIAAAAPPAAPPLLQVVPSGPTGAAVSPVSTGVSPFTHTNP